MQYVTAFLADKLIYIEIAAAVLVVLILLMVILRLAFGRRVRAPGGRQRPVRLGIVDAFELDRNRQLVLVRRDNVEHLIMIGGPNDVLIESEIVRSQALAAAPSAGSGNAPHLRAPTSLSDILGIDGAAPQPALPVAALSNAVQPAAVPSGDAIERGRPAAAPPRPLPPVPVRSAPPRTQPLATRAAPPPPVATPEPKGQVAPSTGQPPAAPSLAIVAESRAAVPPAAEARPVENRAPDVKRNEIRAPVPVALAPVVATEPPPVAAPIAKVTPKPQVSLDSLEDEMAKLLGRTTAGPASRKN